MDAVPSPDDFAPSVYANQVFEMFDGKCDHVKLKFTNDLMSVIVDKFGEQVETNTLGSTYFKATVEIQVSPRFYGWLFGFAGKISILGPEYVKEEYKELAKAVLD